MELNTKTLASAIKRHIKEKKTINQKVVAGKVGISDSYLSRLLKSEKEKGSIDLWFKIAEACDFNIQILVSSSMGNQKNELIPTAQDESLQKINKTDIEQVAITIDNKLQNVTAWMEQLITLLRQQNEDLRHRNELLLKELRKHLPESEIEKINELLVISGGQKM